jgi:hypothetical protein
VQGNLIGTDITGARALGNGLDGVFLDGAASTLVGGLEPALANIISGNGAVGVRLSGAGATANVVAGNRIGTDPTGTAALGNGFDGVFTIDAPGNTIGGTAQGAGNVISSNGVVGIQLFGAGSTGNVVQGNLIGTDSTGMVALANGLDGVFINDAPGNLIGGRARGARNVISGNGSSGVQVFLPGSRGNTLQGNFIGVGKNGRVRLGNAYGVFINGAPRTTLGGPGPAANRIKANTHANVLQQTGTGGAGGSAVPGAVPAPHPAAIASRHIAQFRRHRHGHGT